MGVLFYNRKTEGPCSKTISRDIPAAEIRLRTLWSSSTAFHSTRKHNC